jgi:hypothetical protein
VGVGRHDVIDRGEGQRREKHRETGIFEHLKALRTCHLMDQMQADKELSLAAGQFANRVLIPDLVEEALAHRCSSDLPWPRAPPHPNPRRGKSSSPA